MLSQFSSSLEDQRYGHAFLAIDNSRALIIGGRNSKKESKKSSLRLTLLEDGQSRDGESKMVITKDVQASLPEERSYFAAVLMQDSIYVLGGGYNKRGLSTRRIPTNSMIKLPITLDDNTKKADKKDWKECDPMKYPRLGSAAISDGINIYVMGGKLDNGTTTNSVEMYNCSEGPWKPFASMKTSRAHHSAVLVEDTVYVLGGVTTNGNITNSVEFCSKNDKNPCWLKAPDLPRPLSHFSAVVVGCWIIVSGGRDDKGNDTDTSFVYDTRCRSQSWRTHSPLELKRADHDAIVLNQSSIYMFGGSDDGRVTKIDFRDLTGVQQEDLEKYHNYQAQRLKAKIGNETCSDCSTTMNSSSWVSFVATPEGRPINDNRPFISFICEECSAIHKSIMKAYDGRIIKQIMLFSEDCKLNSHELKKIESSGGNERLNKVFEKTLVNRKNIGDVSLEDRAFFIVQKYVLGAYIELLPSDPAMIGQVQKLLLFLSISEFVNESRKLITSKEVQDLKETLKHVIYNDESGEVNATLPAVISELTIGVSKSDDLVNKTSAHLNEVMEDATEANFAKTFESFLNDNEQFKRVIESLKVYTMFLCKGVTKLYESILVTAIQYPDVLKEVFGFVYNIADLFDNTPIETFFNITNEAALGTAEVVTGVAEAFVDIGPIGAALGLYMASRGVVSIAKGAAKRAGGMATRGAGFVTGNQNLKDKGKHKCLQSKNQVTEGTYRTVGGITKATASVIPGGSLLAAVPVGKANEIADQCRHERKRNEMLGIVKEFAISVPLGTKVVIKEKNEIGIIIQYAKSKYSVMVYGTDSGVELRECQFKDFVQCLQVEFNEEGKMYGSGIIKGWKSSLISKQYLINDLQSNENERFVEHNKVIFDEGTVIRIVQNLMQTAIGIIEYKDLESKEYSVRISTNKILKCKFTEARV